MLKWFDTNYHYIVPELSQDTTFTLNPSKVINELKEAIQLGVNPKPVLISPVSFLYLGQATQDDFNKLTLLPKLLPLFIQLIQQLIKEGAEWIQVDEPILIFEDLNSEVLDAVANTFKSLREAIGSTAKILLATYFDDLGQHSDFACQLPVDCIHIDVTRGKADVQKISQLMQSTGKILSLGCIDGRNIWKVDYSKVLERIKPATSTLSPTNIWLSASCSLLHSPITTQGEKQLPEVILNVLSFATEKLQELATLQKILLRLGDVTTVLDTNQQAWKQFFQLPQLNNSKVRRAVENVTRADLTRKDIFSVRKQAQQKARPLPAFPTTSIGSLPQSADVRQKRLQWKKGEISEDEYKAFLKKKIEEGIRMQEEIGIDVVVHGEFERNDMIEYFSDKLEGFIFTSNGWVQSFGTRYVKPPIIYGDVSRPSAMTVEWIKYASSLTQRPVKGMLTGPITILQWSFVRADQLRRSTAFQIALAIREEVVDLESAGIRHVQVDEPAFREGLPLKKSQWKEYLTWATEAFKLAVCGVKNETKIHTHMCYCDFKDIIHDIAGLDADVLSIESTRSRMKLLSTFAEVKYANDIGPGVYDVHSPRVPSVEEIVALLKEANKYIPSESIWVNPDCGLKTREAHQVKQALANMIQAAKILRG